MIALRQDISRKTNQTNEPHKQTFTCRPDDRCDELGYEVHLQETRPVMMNKVDDQPLDM